jgi:putative two-component system response regulator
MEQPPGKILIVDDDRAFRQLLAAILRNDYELTLAGSGEEALEILPAFAPDLVLLDVMMPGIDGYQTCRCIKSQPLGRRAQVVLVSGKSSRKEQLRGYQVGADDYVAKPIEPHGFLSRVQLHFRLRDAVATVSSIRTEIASQDGAVKQLSEQHSRELIATHEAAIFALAQVAEFRDEETGEHLMRMRRYSRILAEQLRQNSPYAPHIDQQFLEELYRSSLLHDIGKVGISDAILLKPGEFTHEEFEAMKRHTIIGANMLDRAVLHSQGGGFLGMAAVIARFHHERFDGTGYLAGLVGQEIPLPARIVALTDVYDALTSARPYKPAFSPLHAKEIIERESGGHFDPVIVEAFRISFDDFVDAQHYVDGEPVAVGAMSLDLEFYHALGTCESGKEQVGQPLQDRSLIRPG